MTCYQKIAITSAMSFVKDWVCRSFQSPAGWINRFANAGDAAVEIAGNTAFRFRQAKTEIVSAGKMAYRFLADIASNSPAAPDSGSPSRASPRFQAPWFKNIIPVGDKSSTSTIPEGPNQEAVLRQQEEKAAEAPPPPQTSHQSS